MLYNTQNLPATEKNIAYAVQLLKDGELVGIPTETVYGLAANALNESAVAKIFTAKGRPQDNPLIIHLADVGEIEKYAKNIPPSVYKLVNAFSPGPLTFVLPKREIIPDIVSGGLDTVAVRIPAHETAREIIRLCGFPLSAPSANISGSPSPTSAEHVFADMNGKIPLTIDGGNCGLGIESTVISFNGDTVRILRPGFVTAEDIEELGFEVEYDKSILNEHNGGKAASPGMKYKHYSPKAEVTIINGELEEFVKYMSKYADGNGVYAMIFDGDKNDYPYENYFTYGDTAEEQANQLYATFRKLDDIQAKKVFVRSPFQTGLGLAVYNRLLRAAEFKQLTIDN